MIVQILISQTESVDALPQQLLDRVFDQPRIPVIPEARGQSGNETRPLLDLA